jgi:hypothetical protein
MAGFKVITEVRRIHAKLHLCKCGLEWTALEGDGIK